MVNILAANGSILYALLGSRWQLTDDSTYVTSAHTIVYTPAAMGCCLGIFGDAE